METGDCREKTHNYIWGDSKDLGWRINRKGENEIGDTGQREGLKRWRLRAGLIKTKDERHR